MIYDRKTGLMFDHANGTAWQLDPAEFEYGADYLDRYERLEKTPIGKVLLASRLSRLVDRNVKSCLDVGIGAGGFISECLYCDIDCYGYDVNKITEVKLKEDGRWLNPFEKSDKQVDAITCWDSLEHMRKPHLILQAAQRGAYLFASLPIYRDLKEIAGSRHYKPNEHVWYWTDRGFIRFLNHNGFDVLAMDDAECLVGRESIRTFTAVKR